MLDSFFYLWYNRTYLGACISLYSRACIHVTITSRQDMSRQDLSRHDISDMTYQDMTCQDKTYQDMTCNINLF